MIKFSSPCSAYHSSGIMMLSLRRNAERLSDSRSPSKPGKVNDTRALFLVLVLTDSFSSPPSASRQTTSSRTSTTPCNTPSPSPRSASSTSSPWKKPALLNSRGCSGRDWRCHTLPSRCDFQTGKTGICCRHERCICCSAFRLTSRANSGAGVIWHGARLII